MDEAPDAVNVYLSAHEHIGIDLLRVELLRIAGWQQTGESQYLARERHLIALRNARQHLDFAAAHAAQSDQSLDLFAEELRLAQAQLSSITGAFSSDELLGLFFAGSVSGSDRPEVKDRQNAVLLWRYIKRPRCSDEIRH